MSDLLPQIIRCPPELREEALALVLEGIAPSQRWDIAGSLLGTSDPRCAAEEALYVAMNAGRLRGAAWGQLQPGNTAIFWPPQLVAGEAPHKAHRLAEAVVRHLDGLAVGMTQTLLPSQFSEAVPVLTTAGFSHLADLIYLTCEAALFPTRRPQCDGLQFVAFEGAARQRLLALIERTYEGTLDCAALNGMRRIDDVVDGYEATGVFRAENWLIVRADGQDVGVLLLADHVRARHWELMYMGLVPEARGRGWGLHMTLYAEWLAHRASAERIVLAVDAANWPAVAMYQRCGFAAWDRRSVFVRIYR